MVPVFAHTPTGLQGLKRRLRAIIAPIALAASGAALLAVYPAPAKADESPFASIYTADVLPQGAMEIEQWLTWRTDKPDASTASKAAGI
jgi:hypothetical protein